MWFDLIWIHILILIFMCLVETANSGEESGSIDHTTFLDIVEPIAVPLDQVNNTGRSLRQRSNPMEQVNTDEVEDVTTEIYDIETTIVTEIEDVEDPQVSTDGDGRDGEGSSNKEAAVAEGDGEA